MSQGANVRSVDAIKDFKIALINFAEEAKNALSSTEMEIRQARNWLERDQLTHWQAQVKRGHERLSMARTELHRRKLSQSNSDAVSDTEQKEAVREAQRRLQDAEENVARINRWIPVLDKAISEYHSASQPLGDRLSGSFVASLHVLDRMIAAIESYLAVAPPTGSVPPPKRAAASDSPVEVTSMAGSSATTSRVEKKPAEAAGEPGSEDVGGSEVAPAREKEEAGADVKVGPEAS